MKPPYSVRKDEHDVWHFERERNGRTECVACLDAGTYEIVKLHFWLQWQEMTDGGYRIGG